MSDRDALHSDLKVRPLSGASKTRLKATLVCIFTMPSYAVIGASRGIGLEFVRQLVSHGGNRPQCH